MKLPSRMVEKTILASPGPQSTQQSSIRAVVVSRRGSLPSAFIV